VAPTNGVLDRDRQAPEEIVAGPREKATDEDQITPSSYWPDTNDPDDVGPDWPSQETEARDHDTGADPNAGGTTAHASPRAEPGTSSNDDNESPSAAVGSAGEHGLSAINPIQPTRPKSRPRARKPKGFDPRQALIAGLDEVAATSGKAPGASVRENTDAARVVDPGAVEYDQANVSVAASGTSVPFQGTVGVSVADAPTSDVSIDALDGDHGIDGSGDWPAADAPDGTPGFDSVPSPTDRSSLLETNVENHDTDDVPVADRENAPAASEPGPVIIYMDGRSSRAVADHSEEITDGTDANSRREEATRQRTSVESPSTDQEANDRPEPTETPLQSHPTETATANITPGFPNLRPLLQRVKIRNRIRQGLARGGRINPIPVVREPGRPDHYRAVDGNNSYAVVCETSLTAPIRELRLEDPADLFVQALLLNESTPLGVAARVELLRDYVGVKLVADPWWRDYAETDEERFVALIRVADAQRRTPSRDRAQAAHALNVLDAALGLFLPERSISTAINHVLAPYAALPAELRELVQTHGISHTRWRHLGRINPVEVTVGGQPVDLGRVEIVRAAGGELQVRPKKRAAKLGRATGEAAEDEEFSSTLRKTAGPEGKVRDAYHTLSTINEWLSDPEEAGTLRDDERDALAVAAVGIADKLDDEPKNEVLAAAKRLGQLVADPAVVARMNHATRTRIVAIARSVEAALGGDDGDGPTGDGPGGDAQGDLAASADAGATEIGGTPVSNPAAGGGPTADATAPPDHREPYWHGDLFPTVGDEIHAVGRQIITHLRRLDDDGALDDGVRVRVDSDVPKALRLMGSTMLEARSRYPLKPRPARAPVRDGGQGRTGAEEGIRRILVSLVDLATNAFGDQGVAPDQAGRIEPILMEALRLVGSPYANEPAEPAAVRRRTDAGGAPADELKEQVLRAAFCVTGGGTDWVPRTAAEIAKEINDVVARRDRAIKKGRIPDTPPGWPTGKVNAKAVEGTLSGDIAARGKDSDFVHALNSEGAPAFELTVAASRTIGRPRQAVFCSVSEPPPTGDGE
jgi:hypothetical protein